MKLSIILPIKNESAGILNTLNVLTDELKNIDYEIVVINDNSEDNSFELVDNYRSNNSKIHVYHNKVNGLGGAIILGIQKAHGEAISIMMSDLSDSIGDLMTYYKMIKDEKIDAVFGSRFIKNSSLIKYPIKKLILNRLFNFITKIIFFSDYNDFTNAFKIYKKESLLKTFPLVSESYNIFLEIPLKMISRKMKYKIIPISWKNRKYGKSKFVIKELGSKYLFTLLYCLLEKILLKKK